MGRVSDAILAEHIDNAQAWLDNCEECGPGTLDCWLCDQCRFWRRELALLQDLQQRRTQRCETCWFDDRCNIASLVEYCSNWTAKEIE
jgi:hypothetical protein